MKKHILFLLIAFGLVGCDGGDTYTLYRSSSVLGGATSRLHVATFDSSDGQRYNMENCEAAMQLFASQPGVTVKYWCEKGRYRK